MQEISGFRELGPDRVLPLVEKALGVSCTNLYWPLTSYINRVFEIESVEGVRLIVKFYRPGRWSKQAVLQEHEFLKDLACQELPVIAPLQLQSGSTLSSHGELLFALFPKCGGRSVDEFDEEQWLQLGRMLGRVHLVGEQKDADARIVMAPSKSTRDQLRYLLGSSSLTDDLRVSLETVAQELLAEIAPLFEGIRNIRIHGDCHFSNVISRPGESLYLIDFDDMAMGPAVQDLWLLLPGKPEESLLELDLLLEGYETFRQFDKRTLNLIEPLRAMRFIHYMAWCVHQVEEDGSTAVMDGFGTRQYWQSEIADLTDQRERIAEIRDFWGNVS